MIELSRRRTLDTTQTIHRYQEMMTELEPLLDQVHDVITDAGFRPFGELEIRFPSEARDIETRITWSKSR